MKVDKDQVFRWRIDTDGLTYDWKSLEMVERTTLNFVGSKYYHQVFVF